MSEIYELPDLDVDINTRQDLETDLKFIHDLNKLEQEASNIKLSNRISRTCDFALISLQVKVRKLQGN